MTHSGVYHPNRKGWNVWHVHVASSLTLLTWLKNRPAFELKNHMLPAIDGGSWIVIMAQNFYEKDVYGGVMVVWNRKKQYKILECAIRDWGAVWNKRVLCRTRWESWWCHDVVFCTVWIKISNSPSRSWAARSWAHTWATLSGRRASRLAWEQSLWWPQAT